MFRFRLRSWRRTLWRAWRSRASAGDVIDCREAQGQVDSWASASLRLMEPLSLAHNVEFWQQYIGQSNLPIDPMALLAEGGHLT